MIKAILFDLDGTLLNTLQDLKCAVNYSLNKFGLKPISLKTTKSYIGDGIINLMKRAIGENKVNLDDAVNEFKFYYENHLSDYTTVYDDIIKMLTYLKTSGYIIAIISNKYEIGCKTLCQKFFKDLYDICLGSNNNLKVKPSLDMVNVVLNTFSLKNSQCLLVGDSNVDALTGKNAKIKTVGVLWGYRDKKEIETIGVDYFITSPLQLIDIVKKENNYV